MDERITRTHSATCAGLYYPDSADELGERVRGFLHRSQVRPGAAGIVVSPFAAIDYVGDYQAAAFLSAADRITVRSVVITAATPYCDVGEVIFPAAQTYETPLGCIGVDHDLLSKMREITDDAEYDDEPHLADAAIECQLPFLQVVFPEATIAPILIGGGGRPEFTQLVAAYEHVARTYGEDILWVCAMNLSDGGPLQTVRRSVGILLDRIVSRRSDEIVAAAELEPESSARYLCLAAATQVTGAGRVEVLMHGNSRAATGTRRQVVEYGSIAFRPELRDHGRQLAAAG